MAAAEVKVNQARLLFQYEGPFAQADVTLEARQCGEKCINIE